MYSSHQSHVSLSTGIIWNRNNLNGEGQPQQLYELVFTAPDWLIVHA